MNFLSHYYFEKENQNHDMIMGVVLPDLMKNAQKEINLHPTKMSEKFLGHTVESALLKGWQRHLEVDRIFHSSEFFEFYTHELKLLIAGICVDGPVKPFFLAHIGLELMLDHLLIADEMVNIDRFYEQLSQSDRVSIDHFLLESGLPDTKVFNHFMSVFLSERYLYSYQTLEGVTNALKGICSRLWIDPFTEPELVTLTRRLEEFKVFIRKDYFSIFSTMEKQLL